MLQAVDVAFRRAETRIFEGLSFTVHPGHHVGVVGRNGAGKSTLFELIRRAAAGGPLPLDAGSLTVPGGWRVSYMAQETTAGERRAIDHVLDGHSELRAVEAQLAAAEANGEAVKAAELHAAFADLGGHAAPARAGEILHGLGFATDQFEKPFAAFSGGQRIRLNLARALLAPADLLLLDEPTNHLDLDTTVWLEGWLKAYPGTLLVIAHDRAFLDAVCGGILHLRDATCDQYRGNYSAFEAQRAAALANRAAAFARQQAEMAHMRAFVTRFRAKASKARQAQSRLKALERMETVAPVHAESPYRFTFGNPEQMSNPLVAVRDGALGYGGTPVLSGLRFTLLPGARVGILGVNGAGKSTLVKSLAGQLPLLSGTLTRGRHSRVGYFAQHQLDTLRGDSAPLAQVAAAADGAREQWCRNYLGGWGFSGTAVERPVATLSGGEKARLVLALIALSRPALLILDEPTNHLDLEMREALSLALQDYAGALLLVSHDRSLLERTVDEFWVVAGGTVTPLDGDLATYVEPRDASGPSRTTRHERRARRRAAAAERELQKPLRAEITRLELALEETTDALKRAEARLADPDVYHGLPATELDGLLAEAGALRKRVERLEAEWLEVSERLEGD